MANTERAVFPLSTVLYPGAYLQLVIFEPRYLDMVSYCMSHQIPFIVSRITDGREVGLPALFEKIGTTAHIIDFSQREDGLLTVMVQGGDRVCVLEHHHNEAKLAMTNDFRFLPPVEDKVLTKEFAPLQDLLLKLAQVPEANIRLDESELNSTEYVVHQLAQTLPLSLDFKQFLLEENDSYDKCAELYEQLLQDPFE